VVVCVVIFLPALGGLSAQDTRTDVPMKKEHPRIWLTPERITALKAEWAVNPWQVKGPLAEALAWQVTRDEKYARAAIDELLKFRISDHQLYQSVASDAYRWADWVPVVYDWCHDAMTEAERKEFTERYGTYAEAFFKKSWGGLHMPGNNYYNGYMRNGGLYAIAAWGEDPRAPELYKHALVTRWKEITLPFHAGEAKGGVLGEGSQYDRYNFGYLPWLTEGVRTATGENLLAADSFYREFVYYAIHHTTPAKTYAKGGKDPYWQRFPLGDCEFWGGYPDARDGYIADTMLAAAIAYDGTKLAGHARQWLKMVDAPYTLFGKVISAGYAAKTGCADFSDIPLAYFARGRAGHLYARSGWDEKATAIVLQLGQVLGHGHIDAGTFQICRGAHWLTKESTGYSHQFNRTSYRGTDAHNGVTFNGVGGANAYLDGPPEIRTVENQPGYVNAVVDLSKCYKAAASGHKDRDHNPHCSKCIRQFVFLRPNGGSPNAMNRVGGPLVIFDRLESTAAEVKQAFLLHFAEKPEVKGENLVVGKSGDQKLSCLTLWPRKPNYELIDEGAFEGKHDSPSWYQWRMEASQNDAKEGYFLNVLVAQDADAELPKITLIEEEGMLGTRIETPAGASEVRFAKSLTDTSGRIKVTTAGNVPIDRKFTAGIQDVTVDEAGIHWEKLP